ncbi:beta-L-arabinofuranosidase domain-containing protein [Viscerimonas tarda]
MKKYIALVYTLVCVSLASNAQIKQQIAYFDLQDVELLDSPFKQAENLDKQYLLDLDADRLLAPFLREAGLPAKAASYTNWENTGLDGHIGGHYLSALSLMYASTGDGQIKSRLDYMISELKRCQDANGNGYIGGVPGGKKAWDEIAAGEVKSGSFNLNGKWAPLYNIHKTYAGLRDAYLYAHVADAKEMLVKMADWAVNLVSSLSDEQIQDMLRSEHGGLNETFADVAAITGDEKYIRLARRFSHQFILAPLLNHEDKLTGMHANTQIPKVIGFKRIADMDGDRQWEEAARYFWERVVNHRSVCIGGNSVSEHFHPTTDFSGMIKNIEGPETCNTYNMLRLTKMLYQTTPDEGYIDYYERALYNHILPTQHPEKGGFVYFTPMRPGHYRVYSQPQTSFWCCVGSGMENQAKYGEMIYAHSGDELYVNLFIPSRLNWKAKNTEIVQENIFPDKAETQLTINPQKARDFTLQLRYPAWVEQGALVVKINGKVYPVGQNHGTYIPIRRKWKKGDKLSVYMPMNLKAEQLPDKSNYYAFIYGPVVLAAKTDTTAMQGLFADDSRGGHIASGKQVALKDMPIIVSEAGKLASLPQAVSDKSLTFRINTLYPEKYSAGLELIPFFRLHESRYIVYWPQATAGEVDSLQKQLEIEEQEKIKLEAITIDKVICGEQQPESDHFIRSENSSTGFVEDIHWREARGWFGYQLANKDKQAKQLYITYFNQSKSRNFDVYVNDEKLATLNLDGTDGDKLQTATYPIPESEVTKETLTIRFIAHQKSTTARIATVRALSSKFKVQVQGSMP